MIEHLSSSNFSSQPRLTAIGETTPLIQEKELKDINVTNEERDKTFSTPPKEKVKDIVDGMNKLMEASPTALKFEFHEKLNEYYVKIIDEKTKEVVREIPPKKMLDFYAAMTEFIGLMVDKKI